MNDNQLNMFGIENSTLHNVRVYISLHSNLFMVMISLADSSTGVERNKKTEKLYHDLQRKTDKLELGNVIIEYKMRFDDKLSVETRNTELLLVISELQSAIGATCVIKESSLHCNYPLNNITTAFITYIMRVFKVD